MKVKNNPTSYGLNLGSKGTLIFKAYAFNNAIIHAQNNCNKVGIEFSKPYKWNQPSVATTIDEYIKDGDKYICLLKPEYQ